MSGTFEDIHVPPTLVSFAVGMVDARDVVSTDLKGAGHRLALLTLPTDDALVPEYDKALMLYESLHQAIRRGDVLSAHTVGRGGVAAAVTMMALGSRIGVNLTGVAEDALFLPAYGGIVAELKDGAPFRRAARNRRDDRRRDAFCLRHESQPVGSAQRVERTAGNRFPDRREGQAYDCAVHSL